MEFAGADLTEVVRSLRLLKVDGYSMIDMNSDRCFKYRWIVDGYEWEIRVYPCVLDSRGLSSFIAVQLVFLSELRACAESTTYAVAWLGRKDSYASKSFGQEHSGSPKIAQKKSC